MAEHRDDRGQKIVVKHAPPGHVYAQGDDETFPAWVRSLRETYERDGTTGDEDLDRFISMTPEQAAAALQERREREHLIDNKAGWGAVSSLTLPSSVRSSIHHAAAPSTEETDQ